MIATILPTSSNFHAVRYNEKKVENGCAHLLEIKNFGHVEMRDNYTADDLVKYLQDYSDRNSRIQKTQFHVAISCKGKEWNEDQLLDFAHKWLKEMGYAEDGQPMLIYAHTDTDNNHIHIVTSRVAPDGHKIQHDHERRRSQAVLDKLLDMDLMEKVESDVKAAMDFKFTSTAQFRAILEAMNYECYQKGKYCFIKKEGCVQKKIPISSIEARIDKDFKVDTKRLAQIRAVMRKYRDSNSDRKGLVKDLKEKLGLSLVFFGSKDNPTGYTIIDFKDKSVCSGVRAMGMRELLNFQSKDELLEQARDFIRSTVEKNPEICTRSVNYGLAKQGSQARIKNGMIIFGTVKEPLDEELQEKLNYNNKIACGREFGVMTEKARQAVCKLNRIDDVEAIGIVSEMTESNREAVAELTAINGMPAEQIMDVLREKEYFIYHSEESVFAVNNKKHSIVDLTEYALDRIITAEVEDINIFIKKTIEQNPNITSRSLNYDLSKRGTKARIDKDGLSIGDTKKEMDKDMLKILEQNKKIAWGNEFNVSTEEERKAICAYCGVENYEAVTLHLGASDESGKSLAELEEINQLPTSKILDALKSKDYTLYWSEDRLFAINNKQHSIVDLTANALDSIKEAEIEDVKAFIKECIDNDPEITSRKMNYNFVVKGYQERIRKSEIAFGSLSMDLEPEQLDILRHNNRIAWGREFGVMSEEARAAICKLYHIDDIESIPIETSMTEANRKALVELTEINNLQDSDVLKTFKEKGYILYWSGNSLFAINNEKHSIVDMTENHLDAIMNADVADAKEFIRVSMEKNPLITTMLLNSGLAERGSSARIKNNMLSFGPYEMILEAGQATMLKRNNRIALANEYGVMSGAAKLAICKLCHIDMEDAGYIDTVALMTDANREALAELREINNMPSEKIKEALYGRGYFLYEDGGNLFAVNTEKHTIIDVNKEALHNIAGIKKQHPMSLNNKSGNMRIPRGGDAGRGSNREWEVGSHKKWDDVDDGKSKLRY